MSLKTVNDNTQWVRGHKLNRSKINGQNISSHWPVLMKEITLKVSLPNQNLSGLCRCVYFHLLPAGPAEARAQSRPVGPECRRREPCHSWAAESAAPGSQIHPWYTTMEPSPLQTAKKDTTEREEWRGDRAARQPHCDLHLCEVLARHRSECLYEWKYQDSDQWTHPLRFNLSLSIFLPVGSWLQVLLFY